MAHFRLPPDGIAVLSVATALLLMLLLDPIAMMTKTPFLLFFGAVVVSAWVGGLRPGLVATGLTAFISNYFFLEPRYSLDLDLADTLRTAVFVIECLVISGVCSSFRMAKQRLSRNLLQLRAKEESLQLANQRITDILESITDGFYALNRQQQFAYVNNQAESVLGRPRQELLGQNIWDLFPQGRGSIFDQNFQTAIAERHPVVFESVGVLHADHWFEVHVNPLRDGLAVYFQDVTERKQAEAALRQSEKLYRAIGETIDYGIWVCDRQGRNIYASESFLQLVGLTQAQCFEAGWTTVLHPDDIESTTAAWQACVQSGRTWDMEHRVQGVDGRWHPILARGVPVLNEQGEILCWAGINLDISSLKQAEAELATSNQTLQAIIQSCPLAIVGLNEVAVVQLWNPAAEKIFGWSELEVLGQVLPVIPEQRSAEFWRNLAATARGEVIVGLETQRQRKDGVLIDVALWTGSVHDTETEIRYLSLFADIADRKQAETALRQSEERYRYLTDLIPQLVWTADAEGKLLDANQRWLEFTGFTLPQAQAEGWEAIVHPDDIPVLSQQWVAAQQTGSSYQATGRMRRADGGYRWHLHQAVPQKDEQGRVIKWFGTATDIEEQKQLEQQRDRILQQEQAAREAAETANRIKDEFLAILSHELRSPLNPILGWARLLLTRQFAPEATRRALETIERNAKLQTQLIEDLLDVSRILRGKMVLNVAPVNLVTTIEAALETVRLSAEAKSIQIKTQLDPTVGHISGDSGRLQQIVWNLLSNAIKFTPQGGQVEVRLNQVMGNGASVIGEKSEQPITHHRLPTTEYAQITVSDTGKGIKPEFLPYVFEYFRQEDGKTTRQFGGLGLGLAIVRHLTELHGGTVEADSPGEDLGATFTVTFPLVKTAELYETEETHHLLHSLNQLRILVVDDEVDMRELITTILQQDGAEVKAAASAPEALLMLAQFQPDVLISDIGMPEMDGYSLLRQVRNLPADRGGTIPAIALTAYAGEVNQQQALAAGFQRHLAKPVVPEELIRQITALVAAHQQ